MAYALSSLDSIPTNTELSQCVANQLMSFDLCFAMLGMLPMPTLTQCILQNSTARCHITAPRCFPGWHSFVDGEQSVLTIPCPLAAKQHKKREGAYKGKVTEGPIV